MGITYRPNARKILEAVVYVASKAEERDYHHILKVLFYADKQHLEQLGRPVTGDSYKKMDCGPVGTKAYDFLKQSEFLTNEERTLASMSLEKIQEVPPTVAARREPDLSFLSKSDLRCLDAAISHCAKKSFDELCKLTHEEKSWREAQLNEYMDYNLIIDEKITNREQLIKFIEETSQTLVF
ncbi:MAG: SocA family protein [Proteobacteria bacterium]|nr:SocA family protein [Pseudomonadota bacterium]MBU1595454.1 SocA family protein [Pseudomonadota bacterium]